MLDLSRADLEEIATALADQTDEHRGLAEPETGETVFWTVDTGVDGEHPWYSSRQPRAQRRALTSLTDITADQPPRSRPKPSEHPNPDLR
jgi:hypothetical protein